MLFDTRPKEREEDLYDREREVNDIRESVERGIWVAVYGVKRIGKTSVVNVAVNDPKYIVVKLISSRLSSWGLELRARTPPNNFSTSFIGSSLVEVLPLRLGIGVEEPTSIRISN